jgi:hypothetical protein
VAHDALALLGFLSKNMTLERFLEGDLAGAGHFEPLLGTRIRSNLGHLDAFCLIPLLADRTGDHLWSHLGLQKYKKNRNFSGFFDFF